MSNPKQRETVDQRAMRDLQTWLARVLLVTSNNLRRDADCLAVAHLRYERPDRPAQ